MQVNVCGPPGTSSAWRPGPDREKAIKLRRLYDRINAIGFTVDLKQLETNQSSKSSFPAENAEDFHRASEASNVLAALRQRRSRKSNSNCGSSSRQNRQPNCGLTNTFETVDDDEVLSDAPNLFAAPFFIQTASISSKAFFFAMKFSDLCPRKTQSALI